MPEENDTSWPPSSPPSTSSNASQVSVASVRLYRRSVPSTKFDAGTSGVFKGAPGTRSGRPPTMAQVSGFTTAYLRSDDRGGAEGLPALKESQLLGAGVAGVVRRHEHQLGLLDHELGFGLRLRLLWRGARQQFGNPAEVLAQRGQHRGRVERRGGMEEREQPHDAGTDLAPLVAAVQSRDPRQVVAQQLGGEVPERADHLRLDQLELAVEVVLAGVDLLRQRVAVARRAALQDVGHEDVLAGEPDLRQGLVEQPARLADEREALLVLVGARGLADEHQVRVGVARAEHDGMARSRQLRAALTGASLVPDGLQLLAPLRSA